MSFLDYCACALIDPAAHQALSERTDDLVEDDNNLIVVLPSKIHGSGVYPTAWFETDQKVGLLLDKQFRRTAQLGRFINHSDHPNTRMDPRSTEGVILLANDPIFSRDEITMNYYDTILLRRIVQEAGL